LRVEAVIHDLVLARQVTTAVVISKLLPDRLYPLSLLGISPKIDAQDLGIHALFQVSSAQAVELRIGMPVDVFLATGTTTLRRSIPREAVVDMAGRPVVFVRTAPEVFEIRPIRILQILGPRVEVGEGIEIGERVVVQGVDQLRNIR
jgi:multidrug efflux pump subunit AcrA (membrane-fusion protein)